MSENHGAGILPLVVDGIYFRYGRQPILRNVSLRLAAGELLALVGANGAGKTTLFGIISGLLRADRGELRFGIESKLTEARLRAAIAVVTHQPQAYGRLTARENLELASDLAAAQGTRCIPTKVALERMGILHAENRPVAEFSRGMAQRVALARAWARRPDLYLLDEPFTALDRQGKRLLADLLREETARGAAVLFASHDLELIAEIADRAICLLRGRIELNVDISTQRKDAAERLRGWASESALEEFAGDRLQRNPPGK